MIPIRTLGREFFHFDAQAQTLRGADTGLTLGIGQKVLVRLAEAIPLTGGLVLELLEVEGEGMPGGPLARRGKRVMRKPGPAKTKADKIRQKRERRRRD